MKEYGVAKDSRFRAKVKKLGGKVQFPYLIDENTGVSMYESENIVDYLWKTYGTGARKPMAENALGAKFNFFSSMLASFFRPTTEMGMLRIPSKRPDKLLQLWGYEASPFARIVREKLCCLELPYELHNVAWGSPKGNGTLVPTLVDPNTQRSLVGAFAIVDYLKDTYQIGTVPKESYKDFSTKGAPGKDLNSSKEEKRGRKK